MLDLEEAVALSVWRGASRVRVADLLRHTPRDAPLELLLEALAGPARARSLAPGLRARAVAALSSAQRAGIRAVPFGDREYPELLASIPDPPVVLWLKGCAGALTRPAVAIVGSRAASDYGLDVATQLASDLGAAGAVVVSGLARGVDSAAHRGALASDAATVAVLGSGVDVIYPAEHRSLAEAIAGGQGAVVSELPPGAPPRALHFPARNRIISGLSLAVVVIEAAERSGSLITADFGLEQGRAVMAVPGNIASGRHRGCHDLIRDGASIVESAEDVLSELRLTSLRPRPDRPAGQTLAPDPLVSHMVAGESYDLDALSRATGLVPPALLPRLLELELQGTIRRVDGGRFVRSGRTC